MYAYYNYLAPKGNYKPKPVGARTPATASMLRFADYSRAPGAPFLRSAYPDRDACNMSYNATTVTTLGTQKYMDVSPHHKTNSYPAMRRKRGIHAIQTMSLVAGWLTWVDSALKVWDLDAFIEPLMVWS